MRSFYDSSLWESRRLEGEASLKQLMRDGVSYTSAVCVLIGTETWSRRWVRYEITRAIIDNRGLLGVHLNNINHHQTGGTHPLGQNPFDYLAIGKEQTHPLLPAKYYIYVWSYSRWVRYQDYTDLVTRPAYLRDPAPGDVVQLSTGVYVYDFAHGEGHKNIGAWIDAAAIAVGR
jgi:MTH538 TIR-like domain (DUF1863)